MSVPKKNVVLHEFVFQYLWLVFCLWEVEKFDYHEHWFTDLILRNILEQEFKILYANIHKTLDSTLVQWCYLTSESWYTPFCPFLTMVRTSDAAAINPSARHKVISNLLKWTEAGTYHLEEANLLLQHGHCLLLHSWLEVSIWRLRHPAIIVAHFLCKIWKKFSPSLNKHMERCRNYPETNRLMR